LLEDAGHPVAALNLPGRPGNPAPVTEVTLDSFVSHTLDAVHRYDQPALLIGHSLAGATITRVAEKDPEGLAALVFVTAFLLRDGEAVRDVIRRDSESMVIEARELSSDGASSVVTPGMVKEALCADCSDPDIAAAKERLVPESVAVARTPIRSTPDRFGRVPRAFIECTQDRIISLTAQRAMWSAVGCDRVYELDTSHSPFLAAPEKLATAILDFAGSSEAKASL
jgi:pimeloyl-ACP methyl ester carboxylesterase